MVLALFTALCLLCSRLLVILGRALVFVLFFLISFSVSTFCTPTIVYDPTGLAFFVYDYNHALKGIAQSESNGFMVFPVFIR